MLLPVDPLYLSVCFCVCLYVCLSLTLSFMLNHRQLEKPFPEQLYIGGSKFFIGSRRRRSGLFSVRNSTYLTPHLTLTYLSSALTCLTPVYFVCFVFCLTLCLFTSLYLSHFCCLTLTQGLIRQLVLMPGSDVSSRLCPSSDPTLSVLSVPQILLHLPVKPPTNQLPLYPYGEHENQPLFNTHNTQRKDKVN